MWDGCARDPFSKESYTQRAIDHRLLLSQENQSCTFQSPVGYHDVGVDSVTRDRTRPYYDFNTDKVCNSLRIPKNSGFNLHMRNEALEFFLLLP